MNHNENLIWAICIIGGFILGSIMFSRIIPKMMLNKDLVKVSDDHNPGAANVFINCGVFWGFICLFLDMMKGFVPVYMACRYLDIDNMLFAAVIVAPILGHAVGIFDHLHGGKCIATSFGEMVALFPFNRIGILLAAFYIIFSTVFKINPNRVRSIATYSLFGVVSAIILIVEGKYSVALGCIIISVITIAKHSKYFSGDKKIVAA